MNRSRVNASAKTGVTWYWPRHVGRRRLARLVVEYVPWVLVSRIVAAVLGGYAFANLTAIALGRLLPLAPADTVYLGLQTSFLLHALAVIWVFAVRDASRAWLGLLIPSLASALVVAGFGVPGTGA